MSLFRTWKLLGLLPFSKCLAISWAVKYFAALFSTNVIFRSSITDGPHAAAINKEQLLWCVMWQENIVAHSENMLLRFLLLSSTPMIQGLPGKHLSWVFIREEERIISVIDRACGNGSHTLNYPHSLTGRLKQENPIQETYCWQ